MTSDPTTDQKIEADADVVIVGGGIIGAVSAFYLAREGLKTVLVDKGTIGYEQSTRNWGWVHQQVRYPHLIPLARRSVELWQTLDETLGSPVEFVQGGNLSLAFDDADLTLFEEVAADARAAGLETNVIDHDATSALVPGMEGEWTGSMHVPSDGQANPALVTAAFARAAGKAGAYIYTGCAAERIELQAGAISGLVTERGLIRTSRVVCAGGAWAARFARHLGVDFPQRSVRSTVVRTNPVDAVTGATGWGDGFTFRQDRAGRFILAGGAAAIYDVDLELLRDLRRFLPLAWANRRWIRFHLGRPLLNDLARLVPGSAARREFWQRHRAIDPPPDDRAAQESLRKFGAMFPSLAGAQAEEIWAGNIDTTPDQAPVIDAVGPSGFFLAAGFSGHGFALGPGGGELTSALVRGVAPAVDARPFRHARFAEDDLPALRAYPR